MLILNPDLVFPEAYMNGEIIIENASLSEFLNLVFKNIGRRITKQLTYKRFYNFGIVSNYNFP